jgi:ABC-2 type transport system permease protein
MNDIKAIYKREFRAYFDSPIAYIFMTVFLVLSGWLFFGGFFIENIASLRMFFAVLPWMFLFFVPAVTMRLWSEEKKMGTMELLMTLPLRDFVVVAGKFLASFVFLSMTVMLSFPLIWTVYSLGNPDTGPIIGGYLGAILMGGAYLSIGMLASSLTENQIIAFIIGIVMCFGLFIVGEDFVLRSIPLALTPIIQYLGLGYHFESIGRGVIDSRDIIYYLSVIFFFLFLNVRSLESRKWK